MSIPGAMGADGDPVTIEWNGKILQIGLLEWGRVIVAMENWLIEKALSSRLSSWKGLVQAGLMTSAEAQVKAEEFADECVESGKYGFGSDAMMKILGSADRGDESAKKNPTLFAGILKLSSLMLGVSEDEVIPLMNAKGDELFMKLSIAMKRSLPSKKEPAPQVAQTEQGPVQPFTVLGSMENPMFGQSPTLQRNSGGYR